MCDQESDNNRESDLEEQACVASGEWPMGRLGLRVASVETPLSCSDERVQQSIQPSLNPSAEAKEKSCEPRLKRDLRPWRWQPLAPSHNGDAEQPAEDEQHGPEDRESLRLRRGSRV